MKVEGPKSTVNENDIRYIKNPTESGGDSRHIQAEIIHLKKLGSDGKSVHSYREIKDIRFKHDADDEARYSIKEVEESHIKNYVEVGQRYANMTPNKVTTKERTRSEKFTIADHEIKSERLIRYPQDDIFVQKMSKISEAVSNNSKKDALHEGGRKDVNTSKSIKNIPLDTIGLAEKKSETASKKK